ncbi:type II secretion system F family protein [Chloroflexota bacterium]
MAQTTRVAKGQKPRNFRYVATDPQGKLVEGNIRATDDIEAERLLSIRGYDPMVVDAAPSMFSLEEALPTLFRVKPRDIIIFSRQLATLLRSGISLLPALEIIRGQVGTGQVFKRIVNTIINDIRSGASFAQAIVKHPKAFNEVYSKTIIVGEASGNLEDILNQMAIHLERDAEMGQKIQKALMYPVIVMSVGLVVVIVLMTVVLPQLLGMFKAMSVELPLPTRVLISVTEITSTYGLHIVIGLLLTIALIISVAKQPRGRRLLDRWRLRLPIMGPPALFSELGRIARTLSMLVNAGLSLQEVIETLPKSVSNTAIKADLELVNEGLLLGEGLAGPMTRIDIFPPLLVQMVAVGEESNTLGSTMEVVADFYEANAQEKTDAMVGLIGPMSTVAIALLVGFIALSVVMPMYTLTGSFGD